MNEIQRQLLADELDDVERRIDRYHADIIKLQGQLKKKQDMLASLIEKRAELQEGVDW